MSFRSLWCSLRGHPEYYVPLDEQVVRVEDAYGHEDWDLTVRGEMRCPCGAVKYLEGSSSREAV